MNLTPDLITGVVPISKAAGGLAALLRKARATRRPIIVTQKGYPTGVILDVETFVALRAAAAGVEEPTAAAAGDDWVVGDEILAELKEARGG